MNKEFHKKQNFFSFSDIDSERKDRIMKFTSTEATPAPHVPPGVLRLTGAAKEDIPMYRIQTMNKISPVGLNRFPSELYEVGDAVQDPQGILVRSAKLLDLEFNPSLLAIARAAVADPPVMILDEATANIDTETELLIQDSLEKMRTVGTMLIVAHRLSTIQHADNIIVLSHGKILEQGTHQQLLARHGRYYQLYTLQYHKAQLNAAE